MIRFSNADLEKHLTPAQREKLASLSDAERIELAILRRSEQTEAIRRILGVESPSISEAVAAFDANTKPRWWK